jgi:hypothetical protein
MKIIKQARAQLHASADSVDADASHANAEVTEGAPVSAWPLSPPHQLQSGGHCLKFLKNQALTNGKDK